MTQDNNTPAFPTRVSIEDLETAAEWLDCNEGELGEADSCTRVAAFLRKEADRRTENKGIRAAAKKAGMSFAQAKRILSARSPSKGGE